MKICHTHAMKMIKELEEQTQKMTDKYIKEIDQTVEVKSKEILTV